MGKPKLLLPIAGRPLIVHLLEAWLQSRVDRIVVVARPEDHELAAVVGHAARSKAERIDLVIPSTTPQEMKESLQVALRHIEQRYAPTPSDAFLVAPADMPNLSTTVVDRLIEQLSSEHGEILAPSIHGKRGHPVVFPWPLAAEVFALGDDEGLNAVVNKHPPRAIACDDVVTSGQSAFADIDTPEEYEHWVKGQ